MANSTAPQIVGLDTQTLIWALDEIKSSEPEKTQRALWLLGYLSQIKARVVLSTVVVGELMTQMPPEKHAGFVQSLSNRFDIVPFDVKAASRSAEVFNSVKHLKGEGEGARKTFKADLMIVSQAWASGAADFYSDDDRCRKLADRVGMRGLPLPTGRPTTSDGPMLFD